MSDLYQLQISAMTEPGSLAALLPLAQQHHISAAALTQRLSKHAGPYLAYKVQVKAQHPDADPLDALTPGLVFFLLSDCSPALQAALGGEAHINSAKFYPQPGAPIAYAVEGSPSRDALALWVFSPAALAPDPTQRYDSAAWAVDRARVAAYKPAASALRWPAAGLAGTLQAATLPQQVVYDHVSVFAGLKGTLKVAAAAFDGEALLILANKGGHLLRLAPPYDAAHEVGQALPAHAKVSFEQLVVEPDGYLICDKDGQWTRVEAERGARFTDQAPPAPRTSDDPLCVSAHQRSASINAKGELCVEGEGVKVMVQTQIKRPKHLSATPDPETWLVVDKHASYLVHLPTQEITLRLEESTSSDHWSEAAQRWLRVSMFAVRSIPYQQV